MSFFSIFGQRFPFPLSLKRLIYYERKRLLQTSSEWCLRCWRSIWQTRTGLRPKKNFKDVFRPLPIYCSALRYKRIKDNIGFTTQLRQNSSQVFDKDFHSYVNAVCSSEALSQRSREEIQHQRFIQHLKNQKYG